MRRIGCSLKRRDNLVENGIYLMINQKIEKINEEYEKMYTVPHPVFHNLLSAVKSKGSSSSFNSKNYFTKCYTVMIY